MENIIQSLLETDLYKFSMGQAIYIYAPIHKSAAKSALTTSLLVLLFCSVIASPSFNMFNISAMS